MDIMELVRTRNKMRKRRRKIGAATILLVPLLMVSVVGVMLYSSMSGEEYAEFIERVAERLGYSGEPGAIGQLLSPQLIIAVLALAVLAVTVIIALTKRDSGAVVTLEHKAPDGLSPAEVGYIIDGHIASTDMTSLIYYWASHGHLSVQMHSNGSFTLRHRSDLDDAHPEYEKELFDALWKLTADAKLPSYALTGDDEEAYRMRQRTKVTDSEAIAENFGRQSQKAASALRNRFIEGGELTRKGRGICATLFPTIIAFMAAMLPFMQAASVLEWVPFLLLMLIAFAISAWIWPIIKLNPVYVMTSPSVPALARVGLLLVYLVPGFIMLAKLPVLEGLCFSPLVSAASLGYFLAIGLFDSAHVFSKSNPRKARSMRLWGWVVSLATSALLVLLSVGGALPLWSVILFVICAALCIAIAPAMRRPSEYGAALMARCEGFRNFIATAEKSRIEMLLEDDPEYYYNVLPYAHVLGVSDIWAEKTDLAGIKVPDWFSSEYTSHNAVTATMMKWLNTGRKKGRAKKN